MWPGLLLVAVVAVGFGAQAQEDVREATDASLALENQYTGQVAASGRSWVTHEFAVSSPGVITATLGYTLNATLTTAGRTFPGRAPAGKLLWGASIEKNGDPVARHESVAGHPLALRRTFWQWDQRRGGLVTTARDDLAHHRLPCHLAMNRRVRQRMTALGVDNVALAPILMAHTRRARVRRPGQAC